MEKKQSAGRDLIPAWRVIESDSWLIKPRCRFLTYLCRVSFGSSTSPHSLPLSPWYYITAYIVRRKARGEWAWEERGIQMESTCLVVSSHDGSSASYLYSVIVPCSYFTLTTDAFQWEALLLTLKYHININKHYCVAYWHYYWLMWNKGNNKCNIMGNCTVLVK